MRYSLFIVLIIGVTASNIQGQVLFGIDYEVGDQRYVVSLKSTHTISNPLNSTGTAQITLKFESSDSFQVGNLTSLISNVNWNETIRVNRPVEADDYDYITFGLSSLGTSSITYLQDSITPLFSFENVGGGCIDVVEIINNQTDPFLAPNSEKLSIKNHISILGAGGNAYLGNYQSQALCNGNVPLITSTAALQKMDINLYPNPAIDWLMVDYQLNNVANFDNYQIKIYDALGRIVATEPLSRYAASLNIEIEHLPKGTYFLRIEGDNIQSIPQSFVKIE